MMFLCQYWWKIFHLLFYSIAHFRWSPFRGVFNPSCDQQPRCALSNVNEYWMHSLDNCQFAAALAWDHLAQWITEHNLETAQRTFTSIQSFASGKTALFCLWHCIMFSLSTHLILSLTLPSLIYLLCHLIKTQSFIFSFSSSLSFPSCFFLLDDCGQLCLVSGQSASQDRC